MLKTCILYCFCTVLAFPIFSQTNEKGSISLEFIPILKIEDSKLSLNNFTEIDIEMLKFYIGHVSFYFDDQLQWSDSTYHLVDLKEIDSKKTFINIPEDLIFNTLSFNVGVDSVTNVSGAFEGDLDPINGMYWTWNTGYINMKIEGNIAVSDTNQSSFKYHLGGYLAPFQSVNTISFPVSKSDHYSVKIDIPKFLNKVNLKEDEVVMSPSQKSVLFSQYFSQCFELND